MDVEIPLPIDREYSKYDIQVDIDSKNLCVRIKNGEVLFKVKIRLY
jgi:hypothetical protein